MPLWYYKISVKFIFNLIEYGFIFTTQFCVKIFVFIYYVFFSIYSKVLLGTKHAVVLWLESELLQQFTNNSLPIQRYLVIHVLKQYFQSMKCLLGNDQGSNQKLVSLSLNQHFLFFLFLVTQQHIVNNEMQYVSTWTTIKSW